MIRQPLATFVLWAAFVLLLAAGYAISDATQQSTSTQRMKALHIRSILLLRDGHIVAGEEVLRAIIKLTPKDEIAWYKLACALALQDRNNDALTALGKSIELGYSDAENALADPDFRALRDDPRFIALLRAIEPAPERPRRR